VEIAPDPLADARDPFQHVVDEAERIDPLNEAAPPVERRVVASRGG